ncbi:MAG: glycosyltransferase family 2 protein [Saprospiraceae bacterium]
MKKFPKISIVTPNYNGAKYLEETIESVLSQKYPNLEYIIIDGGSTDESIDIIKKYEDELSFWMSEPDTGMYEAIQKGFDRSTGEIMAYINSDDKFFPRAFFAVADFFGSYLEASWIMGCPTLINKEGFVYHITPTTIPIWSKLKYYNFDYKWIQQESVFWRRSLWKEAGGYIDSSLKYAGDAELWLRFFRHAYLYQLPYYLGGHRLTGQNQLSVKNKAEYIKEIETSIRKERKRITLSDKIKCKFLWIDSLLIRLPFIRNWYVTKGCRKLFSIPKSLIIKEGELVFGTY